MNNKKMPLSDKAEFCDRNQAKNQIFHILYYRDKEITGKIPQFLCSAGKELK
jgi:hypothetical protein